MESNRPARARRAKTRDDWFAALDGQVVTRGRRDWRVLVTGIHKAGIRYWIQVTLVGDRTEALLIPVLPGVTVDAVKEMLAVGSTQNPDQSSRVIHIDKVA